MKPKLDLNKIEKLRFIIETSPLLSGSKKYKDTHNFICAFILRLEDASKVLINRELLTNEIDDTENLVMFMVYAGIIIDTLDVATARLELRSTREASSDIFNQTGPNQLGNDDLFFKYIRSLTFAHVVGTSRHTEYHLENEIKYAAFIKSGYPGKENYVAITTYSNYPINNYEIIEFPKIKLIKYVEERFNYLVKIIKHFEKKHKEFDNKVSSVFVNITENPIQTLENLVIFAKQNHDLDTVHYIKEVIDVLKFHSSIEENKNNVKAFQEYINSLVNDFVNIYQKPCTFDRTHPFRNIFSIKCKENQKILTSIYPKIRRYLSDEVYGQIVYNFDPRYKENEGINKNLPPDIAHFFIILKNFKEMFSDKYVQIDYNMSFKEIQILVSVALYINSIQQI